METFPDRYEFFVFDLDGTLADTRADLAGSLNRALATVGAPALSVAAVTGFVGNGARVLVERALGSLAAPENVEAVLEAFLADYRERCTVSTTLYPGVAEALEGLSRRPLAVLTNKPLHHSRRILAALGIDGFFCRIAGGDSFPTRKPEPSGLQELVRDAGCRAQRTLLVGDSSTDILTARAAHAASAFVTYGFCPGASRETPPDYILADLRELLRPFGS